MQLIAYGAQDVFLTGDPQITFWKGVYRRHTHFAIESIGLGFIGTTDFGESASCVIPRNADLLSAMHLQIELPAVSTEGLTDYFWSWRNGIGNSIVKSATIEIGGQSMDKQFGLWMDIWDELSTPSEKSNGYKTMVGKETPTRTASGVSKILYVPFQFWFCRHPGSAIPLVALQYHEVKLKIDFETLENCQLLLNTSDIEHPNYSGTITADTSTLTSVKLYADYVYLDEEERERFIKSSQQYLIEQVQHTSIDSLTSGINNHSLFFSHPVKELIWVIRDSTDSDSFNYSEVLKESGGNTKLVFNGHDRASARPGSYYRQVQPYQHHTRMPSQAVYVYSFAVSPEEHQPSGSINFSRLDNAEIILDVDSSITTLYADIFATSYNVFRVQSGLGGLAYSS